MLQRVIIGVAIVAGIYIASIYVRVYFWREDAGQFVANLLLAIARPWSAERIIEHASLALKASPRDPIVAKAEGGDAVLGQFVKVASAPDCKIDRGVDSYTGNKYTYAFCSTTAEFEKRTVALHFRLVKQRDQWRLDDFTVDK